MRLHHRWEPACDGVVPLSRVACALRCGCLRVSRGGFAPTAPRWGGLSRKAWSAYCGAHPAGCGREIHSTRKSTGELAILRSTSRAPQGTCHGEYAPGSQQYLSPVLLALVFRRFDAHVFGVARAQRIAGRNTFDAAADPWAGVFLHPFGVGAGALEFG